MELEVPVFSDDDIQLVSQQAGVDKEKAFEITKYEKKIRDASKSLKDDEEIYRVRRITESIKRISEYASDIAEIVLNMNIEKALKKKV